MSSNSPIVTSVHPYARLTAKEKVDIAHQVFTKNDIQLYKPTINYMKGDELRPTETVLSKAQILNDKAQKLLDNKDFVGKWHQPLNSIQILTDLMPLVAISCFVSGVVGGGIGLLLLNSKRNLAIASLCSSLALIILGSNILDFNRVFKQHLEAIQTLTLDNVNQFSAKIDENYKSISKTNVLVHIFFFIQRRRLPLTDQGLHLLAAQLAMFQRLPWLVCKAYESI
jgi:hypothetical protein